jgi:hypothetical protein
MQRKEGPAVTATMKYVGLDVHARSTHAAAIDVETGELRPSATYIPAAVNVVGSRPLARRAEWRD